MSLNIGNTQATSGMSRAIYQELENLVEPQFSGMKEEDLNKVREGWQKLAYAIAKGVVEHIKSNMEIKDIHTKGDVTTHIDLYTSTVSYHKHRVNKDVTASDITFTQSDDGTGHVA